MNQREIGLRIKKKRKQMGLSQSELAEKMGVGRNTTISGWETGSKKLDNEKLTKLASLFNVSVDYLLGHKEAEAIEKEKSFIELMELSENESWEKFSLVVDGEKLTKGQTKRLIAFIRAERSIENE